MTTISHTEPTTTLEDVWQLFRESAAQMQEHERQFQETRHILREGAQETERRFQETDRQFQETRRILREGAQESEQQFQETRRILREGAQETERRFQETERRFQETERLMREYAQEARLRSKELDSKLSKLGNRLGDFVEDAVRPAAIRLFKQRGIDVHEVYPGVSVQRGQEGLEIDLLVLNDQDAVLIECKSKLDTSDVNEHLERLGKFKRLLPRYAGSRALGAVAAMTIPDGVAKYAYRKGLFVIGQSGDAMEIRNDQDFIPQVW